MSNLAPITYNQFKKPDENSRWIKLQNPYESKEIVHFHWSDCALAIDKIQALSKTDPTIKAFFKKEFSEIVNLKESFFWENKKNEIIRHNFWEVYASLIRNAQPNTFEDLNKTMKISLMGPRGPYLDVKFYEILNRQVYLKMNVFFLWQKLIEPREFRLRTNGVILIEYGVDFSEACLAHLIQLSNQGILIKINFKLISQETNLRIHVNTEYLKKINENPHLIFNGEQGLHPFYSQNKKQAFIINSTQIRWSKSIDYYKTFEVFGFVTFEQMLATNEMITQTVKDSVGSIYSLIKKDIG